MSRRTLGIVAVNLLLFALFAELFALGAYYVETGALFYLRPRAPERIEDVEDGRLTGDALHPYFGPTHQPGFPFEIPESLRGPGEPAVARRTNNFGFVSPSDYPFTRTDPRQYVVGLFGGSVGVWFCELGAARLLDRLRQAPYFRDRTLVPLCFSHEGYKQPQHLLVLNYFLAIGQPFDLVVNIDGFNEVALGDLNDRRGLDVSMPSAQHLEPLVNVVDRSTLTPDKLRSLAAIDAHAQRLNWLGAWMPGNRVAALDFVAGRVRERTERALALEQGRFAELPSNPRARSVVRVTPAVRQREGAELFDEIAGQWVRASLAMHDVLAARNVPYFHFLQPNQYYTSRRFGEAEARVALSDASPFKRSVEQGYPVLTSAPVAAALEARVRFFDATGAFDAEPSAVYLDNCCHYTLAGNRRLADYIAAAILSSAGPWRPAEVPRVGQ